ncbi:unnamed protein product [Adineta steineri]|uniref:Uncharacterized protein n=1 Tax=Adineta steineri TaxID=433720 RepID=A0A819BSV3_9BILA|nr:unnamed protein product [Adineta steineri]
MRTENEKPTWKELVEEKMKKDSSLVGVTCHIYSTSMSEIDNETKECPCGRLSRRHSFNGQAHTEHADKSTVEDDDFIAVTPLTAFGQLGQSGNGARTTRRIHQAALTKIGGKNVPITLDWSEEDTLDKYHTHFLLLDNGRAKEFLDDRPRFDFVEALCEKTKCQAVTIIIEGGPNTLEVIETDLLIKRPVIIIQGSGRLANALSALIEVSNKKKALDDDEVKHQLISFLPEFESKFNKTDQKLYISRIREILTEKYRKYLNVCKLERNTSLTDMILKAVDSDQLDETQQANFLKLAVSWNYVDRTESISKRSETDVSLDPRFFQQALIENRPVFVDYFLRRYHNPLQTTKYVKEESSTKKDSTSAASSVQREDDADVIFRENVSRTAYAFEVILNELYPSIKTRPADRWIIPKTIEQLDANYKDIIGPYTKSLYFKQDAASRILSTLQSLCHWISCGGKDDKQTKSGIDQLQKCIIQCFDKSFDKQDMLRELFVWSVYAGYPDIAFVLLLQIESRIAAALIGVRIAQRISLFANSLDLRHKYSQQAKDYEEYAKACIIACYQHNERLACQLLVRENPLFGDVTCMQLVIASRSKPVTNTNCFIEALNKEWFGQMVGTTTETVRSKFEFMISLITFGLTSPFLMTYREANTDNNKLQDHVSLLLTPVVKMSYDFVIYVWFLLVFSYMMLFHMRSDEDRSDWTKIYLIITVSTMVIEDCRRLIVNYHTQMMETWNWLDSWFLPLYAMQYILFYIGIICYYQSENQAQLFTTARIILAIDLELWYLFSLRFVSAIKLLGPKLVMIRNMTRDLAAFIYIIFVCIAAYGVVSRALVMYDTLDFTAKSIFTGIFYQPYWLLYSEADAELGNLDAIINGTNSEMAAEATVNQVLLAFHMILINILILNLLIAVFNFTINDVQEKNEYFWRYQRYELTRDYFEKPILVHPPLSLIAYVIWLLREFFPSGTTFRVFKFLRNTSNLDSHWTEFENAATYEHARNFVEKKYREKDEVNMSTLQAQINALKEENEQIRRDTSEIKNRMTTSTNWIMKAMARVKMSHDPLPTFEHQTSSDA